MSPSRPFLLSASLLGACLALPLHAQTVEAIADTYVQFGGTESHPPFGSATTLATSNDGGSYGLPKDGDRFFFVRFDVSSVSLPIDDGRLVMQKISGNPAEFVVFGVPDLGADERFDEAIYTFDKSAYSATTDNLANTNDGGLDRTSLVNLGGFSTGAGVTTASFTSTAFVNFINGDTNRRVTLIIWQATQTKDPRLFASREHATLNGPSLVVSTIPEPSSSPSEPSSSIPEPSRYTAFTGAAHHAR